MWGKQVVCLLPGPWVGRIASRSQSRWARVSHRTTPRTNISRFVTQGTYGRESCWVPWGMVLGAGPRPNGAIANSTGGWGYFWVYIQDHGWWVSHLGMGLPSQSTPPRSWAPLGFHSHLHGSQSSQKGTFVCGWLPNYRCWGRIGAGDLLFCQLAEVTSLIYYFCI